MESVPVHEEAGVLFWVRNRTYPPFLGQKGNVSGYPPFLGKNYNVSWLPSCSRYDRALTLYFSEILQNIDRGGGMRFTPNVRTLFTTN